MKQKPNLRGIDIEDTGIIGIHFFYFASAVAGTPATTYAIQRHLATNSTLQLWNPVTLETLKYLECTSESWTCETKWDP